MEDVADIHIGDMVKTISTVGYKVISQKGIVTNVEKCKPPDPLIDHGFVEVLFVDGSVEHYTHVFWASFLKKLE